MNGLGWTELLMIGVVALIVIGPKDLPDMFRQLGRFTGKMRSMARDFQRAMDDAAKSSGVNDVARDLKAATSAKSLGLTAVKEAADKFEKWDPLKSGKPATAKPPLAKAPTSFPPAAKAAPVAAEAALPEATVAGSTAAPATVSVPSASPAPDVAAAVSEGPATTALRTRQTRRKAVVTEAAQKLRAVDEQHDGAPSAEGTP